jgi:hypothetical protein
VCKSVNPLNSLNALGWNVVRLPQEGIGPLDVLGRENGAWSRLGTLDQICSSSEPIPIAKQSNVSDVLLKKTGGWTFGIGLDLLKDVLKKVGISAPAASSDWKISKSCQLEFKDPVTSAVLYFTLANYVRRGKWDRDLLEPYLSADGVPGLLVITEVLQTKSLSVNASSDRDAAVAASAGEVAGVGAAKGSISNQGASGEALTYSGTELLTFAFKAYSISIVDGACKLAASGAGDDFSFGDDADDDVPVVIEGLIDISSATD